MTGLAPVAGDQLPALAGNRTQVVTAEILAAAAFCLGSMLSPGVAAPRAESVTIVTFVADSGAPGQRSPKRASDTSKTKV